MKQDKEKLIADHAWNYFTLHANQRMSVFNFYLVLVGLLTAGMVKTFEKDFPLPILGSVLGLLLAFVSIVFWRLDKRTGFLINRAENALMVIESAFQIDPARPELKIFTTELEKTTELKRSSWGLVTYRQCLHAVFLLVGVTGLIGGMVAYWR
jgi:uncharacterized membrane protein